MDTHTKPDDLDDPVTTFLAAILGASIDECRVWSDDAVLDATVPNWRFSRRGPAAIRSEYRRWFGYPGSFRSIDRRRTDTGEVVDYTLCWEEDGVPHTAHHVHVLTVDGARITADTVLCGGRWPAGLVAEMEEAERAEHR